MYVKISLFECTGLQEVFKLNLAPVIGFCPTPDIYILYKKKLCILSCLMSKSCVVVEIWKFST